MFVLKRAFHAVVIRLSQLLLRFLPDRTPVTFVGPGASGELFQAIARCGTRSVLLVTDPVLVKIGLVDRIQGELRKAGVECSLYDGIEPDPTFSQVEKGLEQLERDGCDAIVALGGGSPMDAAKVIAAGATNGGDLRKLEGNMRVRRAPKPLFAIPTTAGTGSEVTIVAVVSESDTHQKKFFIDPKLLPSMTALDPTLMTGLPPEITAATGMDALTHAIESFVAGTSTAWTEGHAITAVRLIFGNLPRACSDGSDLATRQAMALASYYAGLAFTRTGLGYVHAIAHAFGARYGTPHGLANAIALPHVLDFSRPRADRRLARLGEAVGVEGGSDAERAGAFIDAVRRLLKEVGIPEGLAALQESDIPPIATQALAEALGQHPVPRLMQQEQCEELLRKILV